MIEVSDLRIQYGAVLAVKGVSFRVEPGQICGYLGPNFPFLSTHGYFGHRPGAARGRAALETASFEVVEQGTRPGTLYVLAVKKETVRGPAGRN